MRMLKNKKGFTLIELLIVITIIGILAVAFLPTLLGAPAKGRDTQRIADLQKIQKVLVNYDLESGNGYPTEAGAIATGLFFTGTSGDTWGALFAPEFGGTLPTGPQDAEVYTYIDAPGSGTYTFGIWADVELFVNANTTCVGAAAGDIVAPTDSGDASLWCHILLSN